MTQEEKAKAYDEAIEVARKYWNSPRTCIDINVLPKLFPELTEIEDERIRNNCIHFLDLQKSHHASTIEIDECIAWLEKQVSQDNAEDVDILHRFSFYSYKDEPNVLYLSGVYVNEEYRNKGIGTKILEVADEVAKSLNCHAIRLKTKKDSDAERLYRTHAYNSLATEDKDEIWLEKHVDKVEPKFKVGDWIITNKNHIWYVDETPETTSYLYRLINQNGKVEVAEFEIVDKKARLWTIQDAKAGDVLIDNYKNIVFVLYKEPYSNLLYHSFCFASTKVFVDSGGSHFIKGTYPATKEQRDLLFQKMKEAGYKWDAEKKELKKLIG